MELPYTVQEIGQYHVYGVTFDVRNVTKDIPEWNPEVTHIKTPYVGGDTAEYATRRSACMAVKTIMGGKDTDYTATLANGVATVTRNPQ